MVWTYKTTPLGVVFVVFLLHSLSRHTDGFTLFCIRSTDRDSAIGVFGNVVAGAIGTYTGWVSREGWDVDGAGG